MDGLIADAKQNLRFNPVLRRINSNRCGQPKWDTRRKTLQLLLVVLVLSSSGSDAWILDGTNWGSEMISKFTNLFDSALLSSGGQSSSAQPLESMFCFMVFREVSKLCESESEPNSLKIATMLVNCHLEAANLEPIHWDPIHRLKFITKEEFSLVNMYQALVPNMCGKSGGKDALGHLRVEFPSAKALSDSLKELRATTKIATELTLQARGKKEYYRKHSETVLKKSGEVLTLVENMKNLSENMISQQNHLKEAYETIGFKLSDYIGEKADAQLILKEYSEQTKMQIAKIAEKLHNQEDYDKLQTKFIGLQKQLTEVEGERARCCGQVNVETSTNSSHHFRHVLDSSVLWENSWIGELLWPFVSAPFRLSSLGNGLDASEVFGPGAQFVLLMMRAGLSFLCVLAMFKILLFMTAMIVNWNEVTGSLTHFSQERSVIEGRGESSATSPWGKEMLNERTMRKLSSSLERRLELCFRRTLEEMNVDELLSAKLEQVGRMYERKLLSRVTRLEMGQIHLIQILHAANMVPSVEDVAGSREVEFGGDSEVTSSGLEVRSSRKHR